MTDNEHTDIGAYQWVLQMLRLERRDAEGCTEEMAVLDRLIERVDRMLVEARKLSLR